MTVEIWLKDDPCSQQNKSGLKQSEGISLKSIHSSSSDSAVCGIHNDSADLHDMISLYLYDDHDYLHLYCLDVEVNHLILHNGTGRVVNAGRYGVLYPGKTQEVHVQRF